MALDDDADALYGLPLEEFVPARDQLAKALRKEKRRDEAKEVAALAKPTRPAWMVNQLARTERAMTAKLIEAAEALAEAQEEAVSGGGAADLRAASRAERRAVDTLVSAARELRPEGSAPSTPMLERVRITLQAAAGDETLRDAIRAGRLAEEPAAGGAWPFALDAGGAPEPKARAGGRRASKADEAQKPASSRSRTGGKKASGRAAEAAAANGTAGAEDRRAAVKKGAEATRAAEEQPAEEERAAAERAADGARAAEEQAAEEKRAAEEQAAKEERAAQRKELQADLVAARKEARAADRDRERARRDAERAVERLERLSAEVAAAQEAAEGAAERRRAAEAAATAAENEIARLEAELREL